MSSHSSNSGLSPGYTRGSSCALKMTHTWTLYSFSITAIKIPTNSAAQIDINVLTYNLGGQKSKMSLTGCTP